MKLASLALIALVGACSAPATPQARATSPAPAASPAPISPAPTAPASPTWTLGLGATATTTVDFSCRLPVFVDVGQGPGGVFIDFPSGAVTPDPVAAHLSIPRPGRELVDTSGGYYYDHAYSRWLPVPRKDVSPDGSHYAYIDRAAAGSPSPSPGAMLHVVDVKTGVDESFDAMQYVILDYAADGIYLTTTYVGYGLWLMNPTTGAITQAANPWDVQGSSGHKIFWVGAVNPNDPNPGNGVTPDEVDRLNLVDGSRVAWYYRSGYSVHFVNQDLAGDPILVMSPVFGPSEWMLVVAPGESRPIWTGGDGIPGIASPIADSHGIWFGSPDGIFLYTGTAVEKVSNQPGYPANGCF
jgi:hypothetical protein